MPFPILAPILALEKVYKRFGAIIKKLNIKAE